jgi:hypothetical protein
LWRACPVILPYWVVARSIARRNPSSGSQISSIFRGPPVEDHLLPLQALRHASFDLWVGNPHLTSLADQNVRFRDFAFRLFHPTDTKTFRCPAMTLAKHLPKLVVVRKLGRSGTAHQSGNNCILERRPLCAASIFLVLPVRKGHPNNNVIRLKWTTCEPRLDQAIS